MLGSWKHTASSTLRPTELYLLFRLCRSSHQVTQWFSAHFSWDIFLQGERRQGIRVQASTHIITAPRSTQRHPEGKGFGGQERSFQSQKSQRSPRGNPICTGMDTRDAQAGLEAGLRRAVVQDKGRKPKAAFAQLDQTGEPGFLVPSPNHCIALPQRAWDEARAAPGAEGRSAAGGTPALPHAASCPSRVRS